MSGKKTSTNVAQFEAMINEMKKSPDIAKGHTMKTAEEMKIFWDGIGLELNSLGPPIKDVTAWKTVWTDYKANVKKKLVANKKYMEGIGGGPAKEKFISSMEKEVVNLVCLNDSVKGLNVRDFGNPKSKSVPKTRHAATLVEKAAAEIGEENIEFHESDDMGNLVLSRQKRQRQPLQDLFENQVMNQSNYQKDVSHCLKEVVKENEETKTCLKKIYREIGVLADYTKLNYEETKWHKKQMEEIMIKKLELKQKILEAQLENCFH